MDAKIDFTLPTAEELSQSSEAFEAFQRKNYIHYYSPTKDSAFKEVFLCSEQRIQCSFLNTMLHLSFPDTKLSVRNVKPQHEKIDRKYENFYTAFKHMLDMQFKKPQNLAVDALYGTEIDESLNHNETPTNLGPHFLLTEMQVSQQDFAVRLMQYVSGIFSSQPINIAEGIYPIPVLGFGLCMWHHKDWILTASQSMYSQKIDSEQTIKTFMCVRNIYLGGLLKHTENITTDLDQVSQARNCLFQAVRDYFGEMYQPDGGPLQDISEYEWEVYEWLEFIAFAHFITPEEVENLYTQAVKDAYKIMKVNVNDIQSNPAKEQFPDIWGRFEAEKRLEEKEKLFTVQLEESTKWFAEQVRSKNMTLESIPENMQPLVKNLLERDSM